MRSIKRDLNGVNKKQAEFVYNQKLNECTNNVEKYKGTKDEEYWKEERDYYTNKLNQVKQGCIYE